MRWRIRHKLTLGMALFVGVMALLLTGTLHGLFSYRWTMKAISSKLAELKIAQQLQMGVSELANLAQDDSSLPQNTRDIRQRAAVARKQLEDYQVQLASTLKHGRDADKGYDELGLVKSLEGHLERLDRLLRQERAPIMHDGSVPLPSVDPQVAAELRVLQQGARDLAEVIHTELGRQITSAKEDDRTSLIVIYGTTALGAVLVLGLARFAYRWIVGPIRELHEKVGRIAQGNFDSQIEVKSGDEMQDLAEAFNDMTRRLQDMYSNLAQQVNERSKQLVRSERLAGVGFLAAGVAHEINNPLASIAFCSEALDGRLRDLLRGQPEHPDAATVRHYLKMIQQEAFRCKEITQRLLEFSRVGERKRQLTDLGELLQSVIDMVAHLQSYKGKQIHFERRPLPQVMVNAQEIKSVFLNLVVNALDSMDEGGRLTMVMEARDGMVEIVFADTGCGMTDEVLENIFEPFFTRSRTGKGTGLGLSISHRVISQHGGEIEAASPGPNQGSTFTVRLPLAPALSQETLPLAA